MTSQEEQDNKISDSKAVFGPLGKYAVVAVIMVSIIITTVIILDNHIGTVDEQLASIEKEVAELYKDDVASDESESTVAATTDINEESTSSSTTDVTTDNLIKPQSETSTKAESVVLVEPAAVTEIIATNNEASVLDQQATVVASAVTTLPVSQSIAMISAPPEAAQTTASPVNTAVLTTVYNLDKQVPAEQSLSLKSASSDAAQQADISEWDKRIQARIDASRLEQKQHMSAMFERIKGLESKQLEHYKESQVQQITHLREQLSQQQEMIESLILRNQQRFDLRAANVQRNQESRESMLNRI